MSESVCTAETFNTNNWLAALPSEDYFMLFHLKGIKQHIPRENLWAKKFLKINDFNS